MVPSSDGIPEPASEVKICLELRLCRMVVLSVSMEVLTSEDAQARGEEGPN